MCTNTFILVILFILKILIILIPISIYILKRMNIINNFIKYFYIAEILFLLILIILSIFGRDCIKNSSINGIKLNNKLFDNVNSLNEDTLTIDYTNINPSKVYSNNSSKDVNYYNINLYPLKNIKINCDRKSYFQNYGNDIAALATALSTATYTDINPYDILKYLQNTGSLTCTEKINPVDLLYEMSSFYGVNVREINFNELTSNISEGKIVVGKTRINDEDNLSCGENLVVIYLVNSKNEFNILNPSDRLNDYFCASNTKAYGTIVKGNQNKTTYDMITLSNYISDFYVLEVN